MNRTVFAAALVALLPAGALAADENFCDEYASQAIAAANKNKMKQCGYGGPRWGFDYETHYEWCLSVPEGAAFAERQSRINDLQACFQGGGPGGGGGPNKVKIFFCKDYANQAVVAASQNELLQCGYGGQRWLPSYKAHFSWCMQVPKPAAMSERIARKQELAECQGEF
jgi:hypothetical protein